MYAGGGRAGHGYELESALRPEQFPQTRQIRRAPKQVHKVKRVHAKQPHPKHQFLTSNQDALQLEQRENHRRIEGQERVKRSSRPEHERVK